MNERRKVQARTTFPLPVIRYLAGIINWPKKETEVMYIKTRNLLIIHGGFHGAGRERKRFFFVKLYTQTTHNQCSINWPMNNIKQVCTWADPASAKERVSEEEGCLLFHDSLCVGKRSKWQNLRMQFTFVVFKQYSN